MCDADHDVSTKRNVAIYIRCDYIMRQTKNLAFNDHIPLLKEVYLSKKTWLLLLFTTMNNHNLFFMVIFVTSID